MYWTVGVFKFVELQDGDLQVSIRENGYEADIRLLRKLISQNVDYFVHKSLGVYLSNKNGWDLIYDSLELMRSNYLLDTLLYNQLSILEKDQLAVFWKLPDDHLNWLAHVLSGENVIFKRSE